MSKSRGQSMTWDISGSMRVRVEEVGARSG